MMYCKHRQRGMDCTACAIEKQTEALLEAMERLARPPIIVRPLDPPDYRKPMPGSIHYDRETPKETWWERMWYWVW